MSEIGLTISEEKTKLPVGLSKFFGNPDIWEDFEWPHYIEGGEMYDLTFMCQINCADATPFDTEGLLPKTGMLYFFYDMDEMPKESINTKASRVLYYDGDVSALHEMLRTDHEGNDMSLSEMKVSFGTGVFDSSATESGHSLLGTTFPEGWRSLLQIHAFETDMVRVDFTNKDTLHFCVKEDKLAQRDFSEIFVRQE